NAATPPSITTQPVSLTVNAGQSASFSVVATGTAPLTYQWQKLIGGTWVNISSSNTSAFTGATGATFTITAPVASDAGSYWVVVSNGAGQTISATVTLTVNTTVSALHINFQDATSQGFPGYLADTGLVFGDRGNGQSYGWNADNSANARNRNA